MNCYQSKEHLSCSEEFYKNCVYEDLKSSGKSGSSTSKKTMEDILKKMAEEEEGAIDSDDSDDSVEDIEERFANVNLESPDTVWNLLTDKEKEKFESLVESNEIFKYLPEFEPWWMSHKFELVQEVGDENDGDIPTIHENIPPLLKLTSKKPSETLLFGLMNALYGYCSITRLFLHDWTDMKAAVDVLLKISSNLSCGQQFSTAHEAVEHGRMSAMALNLLPDLCSTAKNDVAHVIKDKRLVLASLSDLHQLLDLGTTGLSKRQLMLVVKKIEFFLSYVNDYGVHLPSL